MAGGLRRTNQAIITRRHRLAAAAAGMGGRASAKSSPLPTPATACSRAWPVFCREAGMGQQWSRTLQAPTPTGSRSSPRMHPLQFPGPRFRAGTAAGRIRIRSRGTGAGVPMAAPASVLRLRSRGPAHWFPPPSRAQQAREVKSQPARLAGLVFSNPKPDSQGVAAPGLPGRMLDVIPH